MNNWPEVWLILATYKRTGTALKTIESLKKYLVYPNLHWHIADDGSREADDGTGRWHVGVLLDAIGDDCGDVTYHEMDTQPGQFNTGGNVNRAIHAASAAGCEIHALIFDDWALTREFDLRPMVDVLDRYSEIGFIRLSYTVPGLAGLCVRYDSNRLNQPRMWFRLIRQWSLENPWYTESYLVSTQPYVAHRRFFDYYGAHPENVNPGLAEVGLGAQYNNPSRHYNESGPQILFPIGICTTHAPWAHLAPRAHDYARLG